MTSQISKSLRFVGRMVVVVMTIITCNCAYAQNTQPSVQQQLAQLKRLEAMQPDSTGPKEQQALLLLSTVVANPQTKEADAYLEEADRLINLLGKMKADDESTLPTLKGFYYICLIVKDPVQNGPRYYREASDNLAEAQRINPNNNLAKMLSERFNEGMKDARK